MSICSPSMESPDHPHPYPGGIPEPTSGFFELSCHMPTPSSLMGLHYQPTAWFYPPAGAHLLSLSHAKTDAMEVYIQEVLAQGFLRPSTSPASFSLFFVKKKDGGLRPCIDYQTLNKATVKFSYPLPLIPTVIEQMHGAPSITKLDLCGAYNLVRIRKRDEWKTAFSTNTGHYEYRVMPYGLTNASSVFQSFINKVFRDMLGRCVVVYIDDILVYSTTREQQVSHVRSVLERLIVHHLYAKAEKCVFFHQAVSFLGNRISSVEGQCSTVVACSIQQKGGAVLPRFCQLFLALH